MKKLTFAVLVMAAIFCMQPCRSQTSVPYHSTQDVVHDLRYFTDWTASALGGEFKARRLDDFRSPAMRQLAETMAAGTYRQQYLLASYKPVASDKVLAEKLKLYDGYSRYENITGVYLEQGEHIVLVGDLHGRRVNLLIPDWMRQPTEGYAPTEDPQGWGLKRQTIPLREGVNVVYVEKAGNVYIDYFADDPEMAPAVTIHFVTGKANGYFDAATQDDDDWNALLDNAVSPVMDVKTRYMQLAYPVEFLKKFDYGKGTALAKAYDDIMYRQYLFSGAVKYGRIPDKRILARVNFNYFMFRDGDGVAFLGNESTMKSALGPDISKDWGVNHEIGHVMQMQPQLTWGGMTEVSNNLFTMFVTTSFGSPSRLADGTYEAAHKAVVEAAEKPFIMTVGDPFQKLVPFWQLHLYARQKGYDDFYADMMERMRNTPDKGTGNASINNMYEFIKMACDLLKTDLTGFFEAWGFFVTGRFEIGDYANYTFDITPEMVDETKRWIASHNYPVPDSDLTLLTD